MGSYVWLLYKPINDNLNSLVKFPINKSKYTSNDYEYNNLKINKIETIF
jgi:hypothetical protein